jgi:hypothetical protein
MVTSAVRHGYLLTTKRLQLHDVCNQRFCVFNESFTTIVIKDSVFTTNRIVIKGTVFETNLLLKYYH